MAALSLEDLEAIGGDSVRFFSLEVQAQDRAAARGARLSDRWPGEGDLRLAGGYERDGKRSRDAIIPVKEFTAAASAGNWSACCCGRWVGEGGFRHPPWDTSTTSSKPRSIVACKGAKNWDDFPRHGPGTPRTAARLPRPAAAASGTSASAPAS